jgi:hypothetical protein
MRSQAFEEPPPVSVTLALTVMRAVTGVIVVAHAWQKLNGNCGTAQRRGRFLRGSRARRRVADATLGTRHAQRNGRGDRDSTRAQRSVRP